MAKLQISLDCVGTPEEVEQIAAEAAVAFEGLSYEVVQEGNAQWPTIKATSLDYGELVGFGAAIYTNEGVVRQNSTTQANYLRWLSLCLLIGKPFKYKKL